MIIGIVISYISKNPAGLERYSYELIKNLILEDKINDYYIYVKKGVNQGGLDFLNDFSNVKIVPVSGGIFWKDFGLMKSVKSDVYLFTGPIGPLIFRPKKSIVIIYDFAYKINKSGLRNLLNSLIIDIYSRRMFSLVQKIVCISNETKKELIRFFPTTKEKSVVIYPGFNSISLLKEKEVKLNLGDFFLFVGTIKDRKNVANIIKGFNYFVKKIKPKDDVKLVLAGKFSKESSYYVSLIKIIKENNLESKILFLGHIDDEELCYLYKRAKMLVYPSLLEGFGFPILEAMDAGLPVITSNVSSLQEVAGDSAVLVDPYSIEEIGGAMYLLYSEPQKRNDYMYRGRKNAEKYSWEKMSKEFILTTENVYNK